MTVLVTFNRASDASTRKRRIGVASLMNHRYSYAARRIQSFITGSGAPSSGSVGSFLKTAATCSAARGAQGEVHENVPPAAEFARSAAASAQPLLADDVTHLAARRSTASSISTVCIPASPCRWSVAEVTRAGL